MTTYIPKISKITPQVVRILGCNPGPMTLQGTNSYIIGTGKRRVLVDTSDESNEEYIANLNKTLETERISLEHIIITHWHYDHIGALSEVLKIHNNDCKVWKHERSDVKESIFKNRGVHFLQDGQKIEVEGASLKIFHTPGHTTDHVVLTLEEECALFSGDCILGEGTAVFENLKAYLNSLQKLLEINPKVIYPGHGPVIEEPRKRIKEYIDHRNLREAQIIKIVEQTKAKGITAREIVKILYTDIPENLKGAAEVNVNHHLSKLLQEEKVLNDSDGWKIRN